MATVTAPLLPLIRSLLKLTRSLMTLGHRYCTPHFKTLFFICDGSLLPLIRSLLKLTRSLLTLGTSGGGAGDQLKLHHVPVYTQQFRANLRHGQHGQYGLDTHAHTHTHTHTHTRTHTRRQTHTHTHTHRRWWASLCSPRMCTRPRCTSAASPSAFSAAISSLWLNTIRHI